jgi:hypothetical protein
MLTRCSCATLLPMMAPFHVGDVVYVSMRDEAAETGATIGRRVTRATVMLTANNGRSILLTFHGLFATPAGAYVEEMPCFLTDGGIWIEVFGSHPITLERLQ